MSPSPNGRDEVRKKAYKHSVDGDEARRKREDSALERGRSKRDESLSRKRRESTPTQNSAAVEKKSVSTGVSNASSASQNVTTGSGGATCSADMRAPASTERKDEKTSASNSAATGSEAKPLKPPALSLDALAKAKKTLQMQKELAEKMKKLPQLNKAGAPSTTTPISSSAVAPGGLTSVPAAQTVASQLNQGVMPLPGVVPPNMLGMMPGMMSGMIPGMPNVGAPNVGALANYEAIKRAHELAMRLGFHQIPFGMPTMPTMMPTNLAEDGGSKSVKAPVLRLDAQGREIDEHGNVVERSKVTNVSTLKVNINKQKKEAFQILHPELEEDPVDHPFFDDRVAFDKKKLVRPRRPSFQFVEEGKWSKQAEMQKLRAQYGEAKAKEMKIKQAALSKAKAEADINPNLIEVSERVPVKEEKKVKDPIPDIEWWDKVFLPSRSYSDIDEGKVREEEVTLFVQHPVPIEPPAEPAPPPPQPLKLTKKEQKKLRTQRRLAKEKDRQEMIRQGLLEPPKSKVKMSNLMKVLGAEATQDPTRMEHEVRSAAAEREQAHTDRNLARKLTPAERKEKKAKKLFDDANTLETIVSVYRVLDLSHPPTRYKVDKNAIQNRLTGCLIISDGMCVVIVEGGPKSIKRYNKLMTRRINWEAAVKEETEEDVEDAPRPTNKCDLVWQGSVARPSFDRFKIEQFRSAAAARKYLSDANVGHYWDFAVNYKAEE
ncbi:hypothetical protein KC19_6G093400 [Ceratodon purpureus]|uniref:IBB domain-containing protein n=1 Tax=Ceratodon purpureus TaxID=3225 RepID=A0A8T0HGM7_CERPU|nr:hypothetical protein KC19_6G093400 [Ceratodon purpureus]